MKKYFCLITVLLLTSALSGCTNGQDNTQQNIGEATIENKNSDYTKVLTPVKYKEEEPFVSTYYKETVVDGEYYYEVQPIGEDTLLCPVQETVLYGADDGHYYVERVTAEINGVSFTQYRLHIPLEAN